jgi:ABC-2 type transport system ATP-binding protein
MTPVISVAGLSRRYRGTSALDQVSFDIESRSIIGLLGRNGAGKTTLLRILAGQEFPSAGSVSVLGAEPATDEHLLGRMVFIREDQRYPQYGGLFTVRHMLRAASWFYPNWDAGLARALAADFGLPPGRRAMVLSRGMRSALGIVIGLAARAEVTLFDEPYAGLDPVARQLFYDRLVAEVAGHPRTVLLSTHLIDEAAGLLERVLVISRGQIVLDGATSQVRGAAATVSGPAAAVAEFIAGRTVWDRRRADSQESAVVAGTLGDADRARAQALGLHLEPLSLQQVVVHAAGATAASQPGTHTQEGTSA